MKVLAMPNALASAGDDGILARVSLTRGTICYLLKIKRSYYPDIEPFQVLATCPYTRYSFSLPRLNHWAFPRVSPSRIDVSNTLSSAAEHSQLADAFSTAKFRTFLPAT